MTNETTRATYAILAAYARKTLLPIEIGASIIFAIALGLTTFLIVSFSAWWWLLMIVVLLYGVIGSLIWLILRYTLDRITPEQSASQRAAVNALILKSETIAKSLGLSQFSLLLRIVRDVFQKRSDNVLTEFAKDSGELKQEFERVVQAFRS